MNKPTLKELEEILDKAGQGAIITLPNGEIRVLTPVLDVSIELCAFVKTHEYPECQSAEYFELTILFDKLETALRTSGIIPRTGRWPKPVKDKETK